MRKLLLFIVGIAQATAFSSPARAHVGERVYPIYRFPDEALPDLHDGTLEDWQHVLSVPTLTEADFGSLDVGDGARIGAPDLAANIYLGWSATPNRIYLAIERWDDAYVNEYDGSFNSIWRHDSIEFMVDGDHSGGPYHGFHCENECETRALANFQAQQYVAIAQPSDTQRIYYQGYGHTWVPFPPYNDSGGFVEEGDLHRSIIELMITPFDALYWDDPVRSRTSPLVAQQIIGFQLSLTDVDGEPGQYHGFHTLAGQANTWRDADTFVDGALLGPPTPTAAQGISWGRIKASFRNAP